MAAAQFEEFNNSYGIGFDLDGTLVSTEDSFDRVVAELVQRHSGTALPREELTNLRLEGGFNNDWDAIAEILSRRGIPKTRAEIEPEAEQLYYSIAKDTEFLLVAPELLERLARKHRLFIVTGRSRKEYESIWGSVFNSLCARVYCAGDLPELRLKPHGDYLQAMRTDLSLQHAVYVGNSVDDMAAAVAAGMQAIGVTTNLSSAALKAAGATLIINSTSEIERLFLP